ncbi:MAG: hypothetical protein U0Q16_21785 [Bryobacteraceae bacterium]
MQEHMAYDRMLKDIFMHDRPRFFERVLGISRPRAFLNVELPTTLERIADLVIRVEGGGIRHIEFQSHNHRDLAYRQGIDCFLIAQRYKTRVDQTVIYFGSRRMTMPAKIDAGSAKVEYRLIDIRDYRAGELMEGGGPGDLVLATLARDGKKQLRRILRKVMELPEEQKRRALTQIAGLAGLRNLDEPLRMEMKQMGLPASMLNNVLLKDFIKSEREEGRAEARIGILSHLLEEKFGQLPAWARNRVREGTPKQHELWLKKVLKSRSLEGVIGCG